MGLVKLDPEERYYPQDTADHQQQGSTKHHAHQALLFRPGMGDAEGSHKRFHQKVENAIHPFCESLPAERGSFSTRSHRLRIFINSICLPCAIFAPSGLEWVRREVRGKGNMNLELVLRFTFYVLAGVGVYFLLGCLKSLQAITRRRRKPYETESVIRLGVPRTHRQGPYADYRR
jgi:hypothetical protein